MTLVATNVADRWANKYAMYTHKNYDITSPSCLSHPSLDIGHLPIYCFIEKNEKLARLVTIDIRVFLTLADFDSPTPFEVDMMQY